jgi:PAS domain S-box-containing protein
VEERLRQSEERFRLIAENVADLISVLDLEGKRTYTSPSYKSILGDPELLRGTDSFQEIHPEDQEKIRRIFLETVRSGIGQRAEYRFLLEDGSIRHIESQGSVIRDENGNTNKVVVVSREVTERKLAELASKQAEEELKKNEARYRYLFEQNPVPMFIYELGSFSMLVVNDAFTAHYGYSKTEAVALRLNDLFPESEKNAIAEFSKQLRGQAFVGEWHHLKKDGTQIATETHSHEFSYGGRAARIAVITDITERKRAEEKNLRQLEELRRWQEVTLGREDRSRQLKHEVNELLIRLGETIRYPSEVRDAPKEQASGVL